MFVPGTREKIAELRRDGLNTVQIAEAIGVSTNTVDYHLARLAEESPGSANAQNEGTDTRLPTTRDRVRDLLAEGVARVEVARRLGISKATVTYHARGMDMPIDDRCARRYDWSVIRRYYELGHKPA
jgi:DNA-binding CsgD family transcriptional regulator